MAVDASMRKLQIPPKFIPYLEKHRMYELFHDLGNQLAMEMPSDPLLFVKECLSKLRGNRDRRLVILLAAPYLDRVELAHQIAVKTGCGILSRHILGLRSGVHTDPEPLAVNTADHIKSSDKEGWILADYPETVMEAKLLIKHGVLPTHAFLFLENDKESDETVEENLRSVETTPSILLEYGNSIYRLRDLFKSSLKVVKIKNRTLAELANACVRLTMQMPIRNAPKVFRLAIIGPRGSRRNTIGRLLQKHYNLVHVDMESLINSARNQENSVGDEIRRKDEQGYPQTIRTVFNLLKARLNQEDCLNRGYVLTNYPCCLEDFVLLDSLDTPPNRVIFFDIDETEWEKRLRDRVVNMYTGGLPSRKEVAQNELIKSQTMTHPDGDSCKVAEELRFYRKHVQSMMDYCNNTCSIVDCRGSTKDILERVEGILMSSSPATNPRSAKIPLRKHRPKIMSASSLGVRRLTHPVSYTEVIPFVDSEELLIRYDELKRIEKNNKHFIKVSSLCLSCKNFFRQFKSRRDSSLCSSCQQLLRELVVRSDSSLCSSCLSILKGNQSEKSAFCHSCNKFLADLARHSDTSICKSCRDLLVDIKKQETYEDSIQAIKGTPSEHSAVRTLCSPCSITLTPILSLFEDLGETYSDTERLATSMSLCSSCKRSKESGDNKDIRANEMALRSSEMDRVASFCSSCKLLLRDEK